MSHRTPRGPWNGRGLLAATVVLPMLAGVAQAQQLTPQARYSTHDWTIAGMKVPSPFREFWADAKSPGDGITYTVGTIDVDVVPGTFSGAAATGATGTLPFGVAPATVQVVMLQATDAMQNIVWQRYYYGAGDDVMATNARGVAVFAAAAPADTRVVICGESFDPVLPLSQAPLGWPTANGTQPAGFLAVFDGLGNHLWTHHLFGASGDFGTAVTDVAIHFEENADGDLLDVVTYCGITQQGNPATGNATLTPVFPFAAPAVIPGCSIPAPGNADNGVGQWDGFVGRVSRDHANTLPTFVEFHAVVGGNQQDGLFGIAELDTNRFAVVGSTATSGVVGTSAFNFPLTTATCLGTAPQFCLGTLMVFDAAATPGGALVLENSIEIGAPGLNSTIARDVCVQLDSSLFDTAAFQHMIYVVGSTDDGTLFTAAPPFVVFPPLAGSTFGGATDGFVLGVIDQLPTPSPLLPICGAFRGMAGNDGLTGVNGWNEFTDHCSVVGFTDFSAGLRDFDVSSYYMNTTTVAGLTQLTNGQFGGTSDDFPAAMGLQNATAVTPFVTFGLGDHAGGGITQDQTARLNIVGTTSGAGYPVLTSAGMVAARAYSGLQNDAVRTVLDMLPAAGAAGVGRTDGTGAPLPPMPYPTAGTDGGTTPPCALLPFGRQIGVPPPPLRRMLIDYEGATPAVGVNAAVIVCRPPVLPPGGLLFTVLQFGFPGAPGTQLPVTLPSGMEVWTVTAPVSFLMIHPNNSTLRFQLATMPAGPLTFTVQAVALGTNPIPGGNPAAGLPCAGAPMVFEAASPGLWISY